MKDSNMQKVNTKERGGRHLTSERKTFPDTNSANYEKFKKRRITLKKILQQITDGKPFTAILHSAMRSKEMGRIIPV